MCLPRCSRVCGEQKNNPEGLELPARVCCFRCTKSCRFLVMAPLAADSPLVSPKCHLCDPESPGNSQRLCAPGKVKPAKGSAVSAGEVAQQAQWGCQSCGHGYNPGMGSESHLDLLGPGVLWKEHWEQLQGAAVSQGRIWDLSHPRAVALTDTSSWICSVSRELLCPCIASVQGERPFPHVGWSSLQFLCWCYNFCFFLGQDFSPFLPLEGEELGKPCARGLPMLCVSKCPKSSVGVALPQPWSPGQVIPAWLSGIPVQRTTE